MTGVQNNVIPMNLTPAAALPIIREIAEDTSRVVILNHAKKQMRNRRITRTQVYSCLRRGIVIGGPSLVIKCFWRCTVQRLTFGEELSVVVSSDSREKLLVITVF